MQSHTAARLRVQTIRLSKHKQTTLDFLGNTKYVQITGHGVRVTDTQRLTDASMPEVLVISAETDRRVLVDLAHLRFSAYSILGTDLTVSWINEEGV